VDRETFERHVRWLVSGAVQVTTLGALARLPAEADAVALTFDDGFENFATAAAPLLLAHALPVTLFVVTDRVGGTNEWHGRPSTGIPTLPLLNWQSIERLAAAGIAIGAHTRTHRDLRQLDAASVEDEIAGSAECLRTRLGVRPDAFAYPYGRADAFSAGRVGKTFAWGCTSEHRVFGAAEDAALLPRLEMYYYRTPGRLEAWNTRAFRRCLAFTHQRRRLRSWTAMRLRMGISYSL
jgi:peptidoglycan/xylan/chitin deacetylase (PgdA/CDA1 family)